MGFQCFREVQALLGCGLHTSENSSGPQQCPAGSHQRSLPGHGSFGAPVRGSLHLEGTGPSFYLSAGWLDSEGTSESGAVRVGCCRGQRSSGVSTGGPAGSCQDPVVHAQEGGKWALGRGYMDKPTASSCKNRLCGGLVSEASLYLLGS